MGATAADRHPNTDALSIFAGDFNEDFHPLRILAEELAFSNVFELTCVAAPITHPVRPSDDREDCRPSRTLDWITCRLGAGARVLGAYAREGGLRQAGGGRPASDHLPVLAFFELAAEEGVGHEVH